MQAFVTGVLEGWESKFSGMSCSTRIAPFCAAPFTLLARWVDGSSANLNLELGKTKGFHANERPGGEGTHKVTSLDGHERVQIRLEINVVADNLDEIGHGQSFKPENLLETLEGKLALLLDRFGDAAVRAETDGASDEQEAIGSDRCRVGPCVEPTNTLAVDGVRVGDLNDALVAVLCGVRLSRRGLAREVLR